MAKKFDFEAALKAVQSGQAITGKDGVLSISAMTESTFLLKIGQW